MGNGKTEGIGMKEANDEMRRTIRQERSNVLVEVAHLDTKEAVAVLIARSTKGRWKVGWSLRCGSGRL